jgi:hypothetical protein
LPSKSVTPANQRRGGNRVQPNGGAGCSKNGKNGLGTSDPSQAKMIASLQMLFLRSPLSLYLQLGFC